MKFLPTTNLQLWGQIFLQKIAVLIEGLLRDLDFSARGGIAKLGPLLGCPARSDRKLVYFTYLRDVNNLYIVERIHFHPVPAGHPSRFPCFSNFRLFPTPPNTSKRDFFRGGLWCHTWWRSFLHLSVHTSGRGVATCLSVCIRFNQLLVKKWLEIVCWR